MYNVILFKKNISIGTFVNSCKCHWIDSLHKILKTKLLVVVIWSEWVLWLFCLFDEFVWHYLLNLNCIIWSVGIYFALETIVLWMKLGIIKWVLSRLPKGDKTFIVWRSSYSNKFPETWQILILIVSIHSKNPIMVIEHNSLTNS